MMSEKQDTMLRTYLEQGLSGIWNEYNVQPSAMPVQDRVSEGH